MSHLRDHGADGGKEYDRGEVAKEILVVERVSGFEENGRHKIEEKDGVKLLARSSGVSTWNPWARSVMRWSIHSMLPRARRACTSECPARESRADVPVNSPYEQNGRDATNPMTMARMLSEANQ